MYLNDGVECKDQGLRNVIWGTFDLCLIRENMSTRRHNRNDAFHKIKRCVAEMSCKEKQD